MQLSFSDNDTAAPEIVTKKLKKLNSYRQDVAEIQKKRKKSAPEYALVHAADAKLSKQIHEIQQDFKTVKHLVLIGIGGSSLGTEAIHHVVGEKGVRLHVIDEIAPYKIADTLKKLRSVKKVEQIAVCVISKSGTTTETVTNAAVVLEQLADKFGKNIYKQTLFIGDSGSPLLRVGKTMGGRCISTTKNIGGRFSVGTETALVPLAILGHDIDSFINGFSDSYNKQFEEISAASAARISAYLESEYKHYNFFVFDSRLEPLGHWYRQLSAESLGKAKKINGKKHTSVMVPAVNTATELHSTGQLYMSGVPATYTDIVTFDDEYDYEIPDTIVAKKYSSFTQAEVAVAIYAGVIKTYQELGLPYRTTAFTENLTYSLGLFMGMRMREIMYIANLQNIDAFTQPNVEMYKTTTRKILNI